MHCGQKVTRLFDIENAHRCCEPNHRIWPVAGLRFDLVPGFYSVTVDCFRTLPFFLKIIIYFKDDWPSTHTAAALL